MSQSGPTPRELRYQARQEREAREQQAREAAREQQQAAREEQAREEQAGNDPQQAQPDAPQQNPLQAQVERDAQALANASLQAGQAQQRAAVVNREEDAPQPPRQPNVGANGPAIRQPGSPAPANAEPNNDDNEPTNELKDFSLSLFNHLNANSRDYRNLGDQEAKIKNNELVLLELGDGQDGKFLQFQFQDEQKTFWLGKDLVNDFEKARPFFCDFANTVETKMEQPPYYLLKFNSQFTNNKQLLDIINGLEESGVVLNELEIGDKGQQIRQPELNQFIMNLRAQADVSLEVHNAPRPPRQ